VTTEQPTPTATEIAQVLRDLIAEVDAAREAAGGDFAPDSPAVEDWLANEMPGTWGPQLLQDAYRTAELYGASIKDHMLALADAIELGRPLALASLARALAEPCARAVWLLEPDLDPLERVRRLVNDILFAVYEHETLWAAEGTVPSDSTEILAKVRREATVRGLKYEPPVRDAKRRKFHAARLGNPRPSTQSLLGHVTKSPKMAKFFYRSGSAVLHAALHGFDQRLAYRDGDLRRAQLIAVDTDTVLRECTFAIQTYVTYVGALLHQTGWPDKEILRVLDAAESMWQSIAASDGQSEQAPSP
jgi:hypothetical protein